MMDAGLLANRKLGANTGKRSIGIDPITNFEVLDVWADGFNESACVRTRRVRQLRLPSISAGSYIRIERINACRLHTHQYLTGIGLRVRHVLNLQHLGSTKLANTNCFHLPILLCERKQSIISEV